MKVLFAQTDFQFADKAIPLVKRVAGRLGMTKMLGSVMLDVIDYGAPATRSPADSIEVYSNGGVRLHLRYDHFLKAKYHGDVWRRDPRSLLPVRAFDPRSTQEVLFRLLRSSRVTPQVASVVVASRQRLAELGAVGEVGRQLLVDTEGRV